MADLHQDSHHMHAPASLRKRIRNYLDRMNARRKAGLVVEPVVRMELPHAPWPITYPYGVRNASYAAGYHTGEDHACPIGERAQAVSNGRVIFTGWGGSGGWGEAYGNQVIIRTSDDKYDYAHNHLSDVSIQNGHSVTPGRMVGRTGDTGNVTGPHDHFEARVAGGHYGSDVNPIRVKVWKK